MSLIQPLAAGIKQLDLIASVSTQEKLLDYLDLIQKWNKTFNLTALRNTEKMLTHHVLDSLAVTPYVANAENLLDVGSGAGLPGIPLALVLPQLAVTVLDSNQKKTSFLKQAVIHLGLKNVTVVCSRLETYQPQQKFTQIISRAFSDLNPFITLSARLMNPGGHWLAMKGVLPTEEMARLSSAFQIHQAERLWVPGLQAERHLIILKAT